MRGIVFGTAALADEEGGGSVCEARRLPGGVTPPRWVFEGVKSEARRGIEEAVLWVLGEQHLARAGVERRGRQRYVYPHLVSITPLGREGDEEGEGAIAACVRDLSTTGVGFFHSVLLPHRLVVVHMDSRRQGTVSLVTALSWCRYTRHGWYESGGWFVENLTREAARRGENVSSRGRAERGIRG